MTKQEKIYALQTLKVFVESNKFGGKKGGCPGLCGAIYYLFCFCYINLEQNKYLRSLIPKKRPFGGFCWRGGLKKPRIEFINKKIKQLRSEK